MSRGLHTAGGIHGNSDQPESVLDARRFVKTVALPAPPPRRRGGREGAPLIFLEARKGVGAVGGGTSCFRQGFPPEQRGDVVNATLLAQLVAKRRVPEPKILPDLISWYEHYFDVLSRVGFAIQDRGFEGGDWGESRERG